MTQMIELAVNKHIKTVIISTLHIFKNLHDD